MRVIVTFPHQRSPYAMKNEDRSLGGTARQERCARGDAWKFAKKIFKLKTEDKATFHSPSEEWILPAASTINPEEREFVVDSRASMHMVSKKDLNKAELETGRILKNPIMVVTAIGEVQTKEEATEDVRELDLFVKVMLLENTPAVLSLGKLCEEFGYSYHWTNGQKLSEVSRNRKPKMIMTTKNYRVTSCKVCQIGYRSSSKDWLMKVFQNTEIRPVLLMNYLRSREQKWYRVNTTYLLISRKTRIATSV